MEMEVQNLTKEAWLLWKKDPTTQLFFKAVEDLGSQYKMQTESPEATDNPGRLAFLVGRSGAYEAISNATYDYDLGEE